MDSLASISQAPSSLISSSNVVITGGHFAQSNQTVYRKKDGFDLLKDAVSPGAFHNSGDRFDPPKCHPNTRTAVLQKILDWILRQDTEKQHAMMMWLHGAAGAGKSAIAQTIAEMCAESYLLASFFFNRADPKRNNARYLLPTIAYQMALRIPQLRQSLSSIIEHDPFIFKRSLAAQFSSLILQPLTETTQIAPLLPWLIIVDGLDECLDSKTRCNILDVIVMGLRQHGLPLVFLIASRPEHDISSRFNTPDMENIHTHLRLDDSFLPDQDIERFLRDKFAEILTTHPFRHRIKTPWPTEQVIKGLVWKSSGQFIYASTVIKYVESKYDRPDHRLDVVLNVRPARAQGGLPFAELDALYIHILSSVDDIDTVLRVIVAHDFLLDEGWRMNPLIAIENILGLEEGDMEVLFCNLFSVIVVGCSALRFQHASLMDFLSDKSRAGPYYIYGSSITGPLFQKAIQYLTYSTTQEVDRSSTVTMMVFKMVDAFYEESLPISLVQQDILSLSVLRLHETCTKDNNNIWFTFNFIPHFLALVGKENESLYLHCLRSLDEFFEEYLRVYYRNIGLIFAVAWVDFFINTEQYKDETKMYSFGGPSREMDSRRLCLLQICIEEDLHFFQLLRTYLMNPMRSKGNALNGGRYATAALCCLYNTSTEEEKRKETLIIKDQDLALECFMYFAHRADRSEELITQCLQQRFTKHEKLYAAIQDYLKRVAPEISRQFGAPDHSMLTNCHQQPSFHLQ